MDKVKWVLTKESSYGNGLTEMHEGGTNMTLNIANDFIEVLSRLDAFAILAFCLVSR